MRYREKWQPAQFSKRSDRIEVAAARSGLTVRSTDHQGRHSAFTIYFASVCMPAAPGVEEAVLGLFEVIGLLTHLVVFAIGVGALAGIVPLARGRRAGLGLVLMALAMTIMILEPRWQLGAAAAVAYLTGFAVALWLLLGPVRS